VIAMVGEYKLGPLVEPGDRATWCEAMGAAMDQNLHSPQRRLIELRIEHADLDDLIDASPAGTLDELALRRLKKRRLVLRDHIARLEAELEPPEPA
jgi:hypothetical protein